MGYILSKLWDKILKYLYAKNNTKIQVNYGIHFEQTMGSEVLCYLCMPYNTSSGTQLQLLFFNGLLSFKFLNSSQFYHHVLIIICQNP